MNCLALLLKQLFQGMLLLNVQNLAVHCLPLGQGIGIHQKLGFSHLECFNRNLLFPEVAIANLNFEVFPG
jgi:hypothetical protein